MARPGPIADLNGTAEQAGGRVNRQRVARLMRAADANRIPATAPGAHHRTGPDRHQVPRPARARHHGPGSQPQDASATFSHYVGGAPSYPPLADGTNPYPATVIDRARPAGRCATTRATPLGHRGFPAGRNHTQEARRGRLPPPGTGRNAAAPAGRRRFRLRTRAVGTRAHKEQDGDGDSRAPGPARASGRPRRHRSVGSRPPCCACAGTHAPRGPHVSPPRARESPHWP